MVHFLADQSQTLLDRPDYYLLLAEYSERIIPSKHPCGHTTPKYSIFHNAKRLALMHGHRQGSKPVRGAYSKEKFKL